MTELPLPGRIAVEPPADRPIPARHPQVRRAAVYLARILPAPHPAGRPYLEPGATYHLDEIRTYLNQHTPPPPLELADLTAAARWLGHDITGDRHNPHLTVLTAPVLAQRAALVLQATKPRPGASQATTDAPVTVRAVQQRLQRPWATSWSIRGHLDRAETAGHLRRHPGCRRHPTTTWQPV